MRWIEGWHPVYFNHELRTAVRMIPRGDVPSLSLDKATRNGQPETGTTRW